MPDKNLVAQRDGVLVRVGRTAVSLYEGGAVPDGADENHVKLLVDRGLLVEAEDEQNAPVENHDEPGAEKSGGVKARVGRSHQGS